MDGAMMADHTEWARGRQERAEYRRGRRYWRGVWRRRSSGWWPGQAGDGTCGGGAGANRDGAAEKDVSVYPGRSLRG